MFRHFTRFTFGLLLTAFLGTSVGYSGNGGVRDNGDFFSEPARKEAAQKISELASQHKKDLVIESFTEIPDEIKNGVDFADKSALNRMFEQWTVKMAKQHKVNGIYILLSREPAHLHVVVGNDTQKHAFTLKDRDNLTSLMLSKLRAKKYDEALMEGVAFVSTTIAGHASAGHATVGKKSNVSSVAVSPAKVLPSEQASPWGWVLTLVLGAVVVWIVVGLLRSFMGGRGANAGTGMMPGMGGGGIFGSLLGGMFGAAAGMWLYDQFSGNHSNAWGGDQESRNLGSNGYTGEDTDYSGSGGDFGSDFGGGDSGGDMGGGGDF